MNELKSSTLFKLAAALGVSFEHFAPYFAEEPPAEKKPAKRKQGRK